MTTTTTMQVPVELLERITRRFSIRPHWDSMQQGAAIAELRALLAAQPQASAAQSAPDVEVDAVQLAFELGGLEDGSYHLEADELEQVIKRAVEPYADTLRSLASYVGAGGYNAPTVDPSEFEAKVRWGIDNLIPAQSAPAGEREAKDVLLPALRQYMHNDGSALLAGYEYEEANRIVSAMAAELAERNALIRDVTNIAEASFHMPQEWHDRVMRLDLTGEAGTPNIKAMVDRFLCWQLPSDVCADPCASMAGYPHRYGTNLLNAEQAKAMLEYVLGAAWQRTQSAPVVPEGWRELLEDMVKELRSAYFLSARGEAFAQRIDAMLAAAPAQPAAQGYVIVPVDPTPKMLVAYMETDGAVKRWKAMVAAAKAEGVHV